MKRVLVYTTSYCPYCHAAKNLLAGEQIPFEEIDASDPETRRILVEKTGKRTVPQIFFDDHSIGGFDDLSRIHQAGKLREMLESRGDS